ncbi:MAG: hypothetical protein AAGI01_03505 [Myxococcota bacterium]
MPAPWNFVGLGVAIAIVLIVALAVQQIMANLVQRPPHKPEPRKFAMEPAPRALPPGEGEPVDGADLPG